MSDMIVREKCKHGKYDEHTLVDHWTPTVIDADMDVCPGGREIVLRKLYFPPDSWLEVEK